MFSGSRHMESLGSASRVRHMLCAMHMQLCAWLHVFQIKIFSRYSQCDNSWYYVPNRKPDTVNQAFSAASCILRAQVVGLRCSLQFIPAFHTAGLAAALRALLHLWRAQAAQNSSTNHVIVRKNPPVAFAALSWLTN